MDILLDKKFMVGLQNDAYELAMSAGKLLKMYFRDPLSESQDLKVSYKDSKGRDPVTIADKNVQDFLSEEINKGTLSMELSVKRVIQLKTPFLTLFGY